MEGNTAGLLSIAEESARSVGVFLKSYRATVIKDWDKDIKIDADREAHTMILEKLRETGIAILSEEDLVHDFSGEIKWIVDPLDGSVNFLRGIPQSAVSIALVRHGEPILGVVYDFTREEMFSGIVGEGAWLNGSTISVSTSGEKSEAIIMTGFPSYTDYSTKALGEYISLVQSFKKIRVIGSAALSLAYVASGRADAYYEKDIKIWDVAAGLALVKSAGGNYSSIELDTDGGCTVFAYSTHNLTSIT